MRLAWRLATRTCQRTRDLEREGPPDEKRPASVRESGPFSILGGCTQASRSMHTPRLQGSRVGLFANSSQNTPGLESDFKTRGQRRREGFARIHKAQSALQPSRAKHQPSHLSGLNGPHRIERLPTSEGLEMAVRPEGADHQWRRIPPRELSIDLVADERFGRATGRTGAS